nr:hypothetical protein Q903MT_gene5999 [Picea sitchensis]
MYKNWSKTEFPFIRNSKVEMTGPYGMNEQPEWPGTIRKAQPVTNNTPSQQKSHPPIFPS